jgi:hypothetical protein
MPLTKLHSLKTAKQEVIEMIEAESKKAELVDEAHSLGNKFIFLMGASASELQLSERAKNGFLEISADVIKHFNEFEIKLKNYKAS